MRAIWEITKDAYWRLVNDDGLVLAGNIAFFALTAVFPFLIFLTSCAAFIGSPELAQTIVDYLLSVAPPELAKPIAPEIRYIFTVPRTDLLTIGALLTVWTASSAVESIRVGLNRAYGYTERRPFWLRLFLNIVFVLAGTAVLLVLGASIVFGPVIWGWIISYFPEMDQFSARFHLLRYPVGLGLMFVSLIICHLYLPVKRHKLGELMPGILLTMFLWLMLAVAYGEYLARYNTISSMYAGLTGFILALGFIYLTSALLIWGGEVNQSTLRRKQSLANASRISRLSNKTR